MSFAVPLSQLRSPVRIGFVAAVVAGALWLLPSQARAEQFLLFDAMFTYTWDDAVNATPSKSHFYVTEKNFLNKSRPTNWISPVNYRDGKVHIRAEVIAKPPGTQQAGWALCYVANVGDYGCPYTDYYTKVGVYERDADMHTFYNNTTIQWDHGVKEVDLVYTVNGSGSGHITNFPQLKDLVTPTTVRISMVQVSAGSTYDPSILPNTGPSSDGGADGAVRDAAPTNDGGTDVPIAVQDAAPVGEGTGGAGGSLPPPSDGSGGALGGGTGGSGTGGSTGVVAPTVSAGCTVGGNGMPFGAPASLFLLGLMLVRRRWRR